MAYDRIVVIPVSDSFSLVVVSIKSFEQTKSIAQFWEGFGGNIKKVLSLLEGDSSAARRIRAEFNLHA